MVNFTLHPVTFTHTNLGDPMEHPRSLKPKVPIHDKEFKYIPSHSTDLAQTFAKARLALVQASSELTRRNDAN